MVPCVVSYRNSTSNHNGRTSSKPGKMLYLIEILHQTTTMAMNRSYEHELYLIEILHQTTTCNTPLCSLLELYLIEILHQTTTASDNHDHRRCCILSKFYIKPQPYSGITPLLFVVSYRNSTSNHNLVGSVLIFVVLYLIEILHQTTTSEDSPLFCYTLYLIEILHQTTTSGLILIDKVLLTGCLPL